MGTQEWGEWVKLTEEMREKKRKEKEEEKREKEERRKEERRRRKKMKASNKKRAKDGSFVRPQGRNPKGKMWDRKKGEWVYIDEGKRKKEKERKKKEKEEEGEEPGRPRATRRRPRCSPGGSARRWFNRRLTTRSSGGWVCCWTRGR